MFDTILDDKFIGEFFEILIIVNEDVIDVCEVRIANK